jgi:drug/metabolite transporter (DMT)-like permease
MNQKAVPNASPLLVILAFAAVYIIWGSTYYFILVALETLPPFLMAGFRFLAAGGILLTWCLIREKKLISGQAIRNAGIAGLLLLLVGNGAVVFIEQYLPSALAAILVATAPIWFILLDKPQWKQNFSSKETLAGLAIGFLGVILLFGEQASAMISGVAGENGRMKIISLGVSTLGIVAWASGSLFSKYKADEGSVMQKTAWQMLLAGIAFMPVSAMNGEWSTFDVHAVSARSWMALAYLMVMGSLVAFSAYVWLLQVRPATQVSTYAYVNPVVAVLLGVFLAHENVSWMQIAGLATILGGVLLVNLAKMRKSRQSAP